MKCKRRKLEVEAAAVPPSAGALFARWRELPAEIQRLVFALVGATPVRSLSAGCALLRDIPASHPFLVLSACAARRLAASESRPLGTALRSLGVRSPLAPLAPLGDAAGAVLLARSHAKLQHLALRAAALASRSASAIVAALAPPSALRSLALCDNPELLATAASAEHLAHGLAQATALTELHLAGCGLHGAKAAALGAALGAAPRLRTLDLSRNPLGAGGLPGVASAPLLATLRLAQCELGPPGAEQLARELNSRAASRKPLLELDLAGNRRVGPRPWAAIAHAAQGTRRIVLRACGLPPHVVARCRAADELDVSLNGDLGNLGAGHAGLAVLRAHACGLTQTPSHLPLRCLQLAGNPLASSGLAAFFGQVAASALEELDLTECGIADSDAAAMSLGARRLVVLSLARNPLRDEGVARLARALAAQRGGALRRLDLRQCSVREAGAAAAALRRAGDAQAAVREVRLAGDCGTASVTLRWDRSPAQSVCHK